MADNRTMEELIQAPTEGYGEAIVILEINADHFEIKTNFLQLVQANPDVPNDVTKLMMFSYSLKGNARVWYDKEPPNSILTWEDLVNKFVNQFFPPSKTTHLKNEYPHFTQRFEETFGEAWERFKEMFRACPHHGFTELAQIDTFYNGLNDDDQDSLNAATGGNILSKTTREALQIIENKSKVHYSRNKPNISRMNTTSRKNANKSDDRIDKLADQILTLVEIFAKKIVTPAPVKAVEESYVTCGGNHAYYNCPNTDRNQPSVCVATGTYNQVSPQDRASNNMAPPGFAPNQSSTSGTLSSNTILNPKGEMKAITTQSGVAYQGPSIPTPKKVVKRETEETTDKEQSNFQESTAHIQPPVTLILKPDVSKTLPKPNIPYPSRLNDQKLRKKPTNQIEKFFQIFQDLHFDISFADALLLMPKFDSTIKSLLTNKDKLFELAKIPLNENCSAMLLKKLPEKLRDPGKFLILCDFPGMDVCHALADLGASINLMPFSIWKKLSLPKLTPTRMTLEITDRSITHPKGVAKDVFVKVGKFYFSTDFVVVDFEADPHVSLILVRSFLRTSHALIDVYREEITHRVNDEAATFNLYQSTIYSSTYDDLSVNRIDIIDVAREEYAQEILGFSSNSLGGNPTLTFKPILSDSSPFLTPFEGSDFILEEINAYLKDESISPEIDHFDCDSKGDICLIEKLLNDDPFIQDFSKIARPMTQLLEKETLFVFSKDCIDAFETLEKKLIEALILVVPDWNPPFELTYDAIDFAIGAVLGQRDHQKLQLYELNELCDQAYENSLIYKEKTKKIHDSKIKNRIFNVGDRVLLFNSRLKIFSGKLKTRWSGTFTITKVFPYMTVELSQPDGPNFKGNGHRVKYYFGGDVP
nr:reverse transcriptase domain-containing protein [Tanacetum cinerariifolium]